MLIWASQFIGKERLCQYHYLKLPRTLVSTIKILKTITSSVAPKKYNDRCNEVASVLEIASRTVEI